MTKTLQQKVEAIRNDFIKSLPKRANKILALSRELSEKPWEASTAKELKYETHNLRGFSGSHGLVMLNALSGKVENLVDLLIKSNKGLTLDQKSKLHICIDELQHKMHSIHDELVHNPISLLSIQPQSTDEKQPTHQAPLLLIVDDDRDFCESISVQLMSLGYRTRYIYNLEDLEQSIHAYSPNAIFMDIMFNDNKNAGIEIINGLREKEDIPCPIIYMSARDDIDARLLAVRSGGVAFINKNFRLGELKNTLALTVPLQENLAFKVLIIDDDKNSAEYCKAILEHANIKVYYLNSATDIFEYIINYEPDVILLDMYMPNIDGIELACIIRQHQAFSFIPIVIMSGETDMNKQFKMRRAGADDFILKPFKPHHLVDTILNRIQRSRHTKQLIYTDGLTSLMLFTKVKDHVLNLIDSCLRYNLDLSVALIDLDFFKHVNDKYGHLVGDQILCRFADFLLSRVRKADMVTRYGGEEFAIIFPYTTGENAIAALNSIREEFSKSIQNVNGNEFKVTFSDGIASINHNHQDIESLLYAADTALYEAKADGRDSIKLAN